MFVYICVGSEEVTLCQQHEQGARMNIEHVSNKCSTHARSDDVVVGGGGGGGGGGIGQVKPDK